MKKLIIICLVLISGNHLQGSSEIRTEAVDTIWAHGSYAGPRTHESSITVRQNNGHGAFKEVGYAFFEWESCRLVKSVPSQDDLLVSAAIFNEAKKQARRQNCKTLSYYCPDQRHREFHKQLGARAEANDDVVYDLEK